jgi:hypothetical protein
MASGQLVEFARRIPRATAYPKLGAFYFEAAFSVSK